MRYLVTARVRPGRQNALARAIQDQTLGVGSIAGDEYLRNMAEARVDAGGRVQWVEVCYCATPLAEERPYWEEYFALEKIQNAHARSRCRDLSGEAPWSCGDCDCSARLERRLASRGERFLSKLKAEEVQGSEVQGSEVQKFTGSEFAAALKRGTLNPEP